MSIISDAYSCAQPSLVPPNLSIRKLDETELVIKNFPFEMCLLQIDEHEIPRLPICLSAKHTVPWHPSKQGFSSFVLKSLATSLALMIELDDVPLFTRTHLVGTGALPVLAQHSSSVDSIPTSNCSMCAISSFSASWSTSRRAVLQCARHTHLVSLFELALILQIISFLVHLELSHHGLVTTLT